MPSPDAPPLTRGVVLRGIGFAAAIALGAIAVWLIVTSMSQKRIEIGILTGLWGLLLGAYSMFGARRTPGVDGYDEPARELAVRESRAVERGDDAAARRDWEARLERLIQREISTAVSRETTALRSEIAHLRQELLEKVGGQIRLERIETTRVIGSDLEALQHEVRQLKVANGNLGVKELLAQSGDPRQVVRQVVEPARIRPVSRPTAEVEADIRPAQRAAAEEPPVPAAPAVPVAKSGNAPIGQRPAQAAPARTAPSAAPRRDQHTETRPVAPVPQTAAAEPARVDQTRSETVRVAPTQRPATPVVPSPAAAAPAAAVAPRRQAPAAPVVPSATPAPPASPAPAAAAPVRAANGSSAPTPPATAPTAPPARTTPPVAPPAQPARTPAARDDADPFANLPRIRPFTDFALEPAGPTAPAAAPRTNGTPRNGTPRNGAPANGAPANGAPGNGAPANGAPANGAGLYTGRRRRTDGDTAAAPGKHAGSPAAAPEPAVAPTSPAQPGGHAESEAGGGRRRRTDGHDDGSDLLAKLLARESVDR